MFGAKCLKALVLSAIVLASMSIVGCKENEHPAEHPKESEKKAPITKDELADAIEAYVKKEAAAKEGFFVALDEKTGKELKLTLDKVHRKRLAKVGESLYFACADFKTPEGKIYDLDVFMEGPDKDHLTFSKFSIHKEEGKERYTWYEEGGIWKKKPVGTAVEPPVEHPKEHPEEHPKEDPKEHPKEHPKEPPKEHPREHPK